MSFIPAALKVSSALMQLGWWETLIRAIGAGFLIASMVWMLPTAESGKFAVIALMTYLISVAGFTHIVAGSMEAYLLVDSANGSGGSSSSISSFRR